MEIVLFTGVGIMLYFLCDRLLLLLEKMHGEALPARSVIFFVLIMSLSLSVFSVMRTLLHTEEERSQYDQQEQHSPDRGD